MALWGLLVVGGNRQQYAFCTGTCHYAISRGTFTSAMGNPSMLSQSGVGRDWGRAHRGHPSEEVQIWGIQSQAWVSRSAPYGRRSDSEELHQAGQRGLEDWLKLRAQRGHSPSLEELRAKGLEGWLKLRNQRTAEKSVDSSDQATDRAHTEKNDLSKKHDSGIDDDLKS